MNQLEQLRLQIKQTDEAIILSLAKRQKLSKQIGQLKAAQGKEIVDLAQEKELFKCYEKLAEQYGLQPAFIEKLFEFIITYSRKIQLGESF